MKNFIIFLIEKYEVPNIHVDLDLHQLFGSSETSPNEDHPIVEMLKKHIALKGNATLIFKGKIGETTHTFIIPPTEGQHARRRNDVTHTTKHGENLQTTHIELKSRSTLNNITDDEMREILKGKTIPGKGLRSKVNIDAGKKLISHLVKKFQSAMRGPKKNKGRRLMISKNKDHRDLFPNAELNRQILDLIEQLPKSKRKLTRQAFRLFRERMTTHVKPDTTLNTEFHDYDLDNKDDIEKLKDRYSSKFSQIDTPLYISVHMPNGKYAIVRHDQEKPIGNEEILNGNSSLTSIGHNTELHQHYVTLANGNNNTRYTDSHQEAKDTIDGIRSGRPVTQLNAR